MSRSSIIAATASASRRGRGGADGRGAAERAGQGDHADDERASG